VEGSPLVAQEPGQVAVWSLSHHRDSAVPHRRLGLGPTATFPKARQQPGTVTPTEGTGDTRREVKAEGEAC